MLRASGNCLGRGRDEDCSSPPAQIPAGAANAPGSSLGFWRQNGGRAAGVKIDLSRQYRVRIPIYSGRVFRREAGHRSDLKPAVIPK